MLGKILPLVTIAIPTYNRAASYLPQALESALNQTYANLEIIVSDNCSIDNTPNLMTSIADPRVRYFRHEVNIGANSNFNFCIEQAKGSYLLLLHDDDMIDKDFVESCIQGAQCASEVGIIRTGTRLIDFEGNLMRELPNTVVGFTTDAFFREWFSGKTALYLCSTLFNTKRLREIGGFNSKHNCYEDVIAQARLAAKYGRIDVPEVKASFRIHQGEMGFDSKIDEWCEDSLILLHLMCELVPENKDQVLMEGLRFFSRANYHRASAANSPFERFVAFMKVIRYFKYRRLPSLRVLLHIFHGTRLYAALRFIKRNLKYASEV